MTNSRDTILSAIRESAAQRSGAAGHAAVGASPEPGSAAPGSFTSGIRYADPQAQFSEALAAVGGVMLAVPDVATAERQLRATPAFSTAKKICSLVPGFECANVSLAAIDDPHLLEDIDVAILPGVFAVAENAAVWFTARGVRHRVLPFIAQHLVLVVPAQNLVHNMHEAYERLSFQQAEFGTFISGPSKTADIEQSLVIGAHGPRSLTVCLQS